MRLVSVSVFLVLSLIAALHVYWGAGGLWPGDDVRSLIDAVIGDPRFEAMPPARMIYIVAALIFSCGVFALIATSRVAGPLRFIAKSAVAVISAVFVMRGASGYFLPEAVRAQLTEPFATYDRIFYSPLCLVLGAAFFILFFARAQSQSTEARA